MKTRRRDVIRSLGAAAALAVAPKGLAYACEEPAGSISSSWWGSGRIMTSLGNTTLIANKTVTQSFRAQRSGYIKSVIWYNIHSTSKPGYSLGTGGNIRVRIEGSDSRGYANNVVLGGSNTLYNAASAPVFPKQVLSAPAPVQAGKIYHVTFLNTHSDASSNFVSTDCMHITDSLNVSPHNPQIPDIEDSVYKKFPGKEWIKRSQTPILDLEYTDGFHQGTPYIDVFRGSNSANYNTQVTSSQWSRQYFTPPEDITITKMAVSARYRSGSGNLVMELWDESKTMLRRATWSYTEITSDYQGWAPAKPINPLGVNAGTRYSWVIKATSGVFTSYPLQNGALKYGFSPSIAVNGYCEFSTNSGASWSGGWSAWNQNQRKDGILIFYFGLA